jgi:hypothetical protein
MTSFGQFSKLGDMVQNGGNYKTEAKVMVNASPRAVQEHRGRKDAKMEVKTKADSDAPWVKSSSATVARGNLSNRAAMPGIVDAEAVILWKAQRKFMVTQLSQHLIPTWWTWWTWWTNEHP